MRTPSLVFFLILLLIPVSDLRSQAPVDIQVRITGVRHFFQCNADGPFGNPEPRYRVRGRYVGAAYGATQIINLGDGVPCGVYPQNRLVFVDTSVCATQFQIEVDMWEEDGCGSDITYSNSCTFNDDDNRTFTNPVYNLAAYPQGTSTFSISGAGGYQVDFELVWTEIAPPNISPNSVLTVCSGSNATLTATPPTGGMGGDFVWYNGPMSLTPLFTGATYTPVVSDTGSFWVSYRVGTCETERTQVPVDTLPNGIGIDTQIACNAYTWIDGNTYTSSNNTAVVTFPGGSSNGCDSLLRLDLTILNPATGTDVQTACNSYTWIDGNTYTASNDTATFTLVGGAANGCDSIVTLDLTLLNSTTGIDVQTACNTYTWIDGNTYTASNDTATFTLAGGAANGCDSVVTLDLTVLNSATGTDVQTACNSFTWIDGNTYTASNNTATFTITGGAANGCDSVVTLNLNLNSVSDVSTATNGSTITANNANANYQWLDCSNGFAEIPGATGQSFTPATSGNYAVRLIQNECVDTSTCVAVTAVGIEENDFGPGLTLYPNPTDGLFAIDLGARYASTHIRVYDLNGRLMQSYQFTETKQQVELSLDAPTGIYLVKVHAEDKHAVIRLVKE